MSERRERSVVLVRSGDAMNKIIHMFYLIFFLILVSSKCLKGECTLRLIIWENIIKNYYFLLQRSKQQRRRRRTEGDITPSLVS